MDRQQPDRVRALLLGDRLELRRADGLLLLHEADEPGHVRPAELLVRACEPPELAQVRVAAAPVPLGEDGQVVVVLGEDALAEALEREPRHRLDEALVPLQEGTDEPGVFVRERLRHLALDPAEERPARGGAADEDERVVRDPDERRREHGSERHVVVAVVEEPQVQEQVDHLLLAEVAASGGAVGRQADAAELLLVPLRVGAGGEQDDDLAGRGRPGVHQLAHAAGDRASLAGAPVRAGAGIRGLVGDEQLHRVPEDGIGELAGRVQRLEVAAELAAEELVHRCEHLGPRAVVPDEGEAPAGLVAARAEDGDVGVAEAVDRLELVADREHLRPRPGDQVDELALEPVRVLELVHHHGAEPELLALADGVVVAEEVAREELEVLEVEGRLAPLRLGVRVRERVEQLLEELAVCRRQLVQRRLLDGLAGALVR